MEEIDNKKIEQVVRKVDPSGKLLRTWQLEGGVSAQVIAFEVQRSDGQNVKMILRRHGEVDFEHNHNIAEDEFKLLEILHKAGLAVPKPYLVDKSCEIFSTPYLVIEYIDGNTVDNPTDLSRFIHQLAEHLVKIHNINTSKYDLSFLPDKTTEAASKLQNKPERLDESMGEGQIREVLGSVWPVTQQNESVIVHGDFWPGNTLWKNERLLAIIDWEDAGYGDPLADIANCRLEILWLFGVDIMNEFTDQYKSMSKISINNLPYWDLVAALKPCSKIYDWGLDEETLNQMIERHKLFVYQAIEKLSSFSN